MKKIIVAVIGLLVIAFASSYGQEFETRRARMVETQIVRRGITDEAVLRAMRTVPRHRLVPEKYVESAYDDRPLAIGYGQTISQPFIVAYMTELLELEPGDRVLEVGTGSGYQAAVLAEIIDEVYSIEIVPELAKASSERIRSLGYDNIRTKNADGYYGWKEYAPFDAIIVTAAAEHIPPPLIRQLKDGGRMVIPVGSPFFTQSLMLVQKKEGRTTTKSMMPVVFVPFTRLK
ncbi:MAG: protein-L-isoaspartate(D-aspartate) O-methyltransferase [Rhodothermia bacterium]|nr:MAG: protein-L-isoaspartate(D-aspartate) O-methyltransferase [Rhodothermia bacterium]